MKETQDRLFDLQDSQYEYPYHYLSGFDKEGAFRLHRHLEWGLEHITYTSHVIRILKQLQPTSILDVGCGDGRLLSSIQDIVPLKRGIDLSEKAIGLARALNPAIEFVCDRLEVISDKFSVVTVIEVLEHVPDEDIPSFIRSVSYKLADGGYLIVSVPTTNVPLNDKHYRHYAFESLQQTLSPNFAIGDSWWLYRRNLLEKLLRHLLSNRIFILNSSTGRAFVWRIHSARNFYADPSDGAHLVCIARLLDHRR